MATETKIVLTAQDKTRAAVDSAKRNLAGMQAHGATIENISSLEEVARRTGAGLDPVETALVKMNQALFTASDPNRTAAGALKAIGLSADELKKQDPAEALLAIAQALDGYADDANKARLVQELFGKSLKEVAPLLHDLAEQGKLNATVTEEQAKEAEKFNKQLFELQTNVSNIGRAIALDMLPALNAAGYQFSEQAKQAGLLQGALVGIGELSSPLRTVFETIAVLGINVAYVFKEIGTEVGGMGGRIPDHPPRGGPSAGHALREGQGRDHQNALRAKDGKFLSRLAPDPAVRGAYREPAVAEGRPGIRPDRGQTVRLRRTDR